MSDPPRDAPGTAPVDPEAAGGNDDAASHAPATERGARWSPTLQPHISAGTVVGDYEIRAELGQGGNARVFGAVHSVIDKEAAIKILNIEHCGDPVAVNRFVQEARAVNRIRHRNIVDIFDFGELPSGQCYLAMERLHGETLWQRLRRGPVPASEAVDILTQIARTLQIVHRHGIVHRDLKPANMFLTRDDEGRLLVKLLDFGVAKLTDERWLEAHKTHKTQTGVILGTPDYTSPEQARSQPADHRADIYSLGVMAFEVLSGERPFSGEAPLDLLMHHVATPPPSLRKLAPTVSLDLDRTISAMMSKDPGERPPLDAFCHALEGLLDARRSPAPVRKMAAIGLAVALLVAGSVLVLASVSSDMGEAPGEAGDDSPATAQTTAQRTPPRPAAHLASSRDGEERASDAAPAGASERERPGPPPATSGAPAQPAQPSRVGRHRSGRPPTGNKPPALLTVNARPWVEVWVDGRKVKGETPLRSHPLAPGRHTLTFVNSLAGFRQERSMTLTSGEATHVFVDVSAATIEVK